MFELLFGYWLGKKSEKRKQIQEDIDIWRFSGQKTRSVQELLEKARRLSASENN